MSGDIKFKTRVGISKDKRFRAFFIGNRTNNDTNQDKFTHENTK
jgi:hypothetical protein